MSDTNRSSQQPYTWSHHDCFGFDPFDYTNSSMRPNYTVEKHSHTFHELNIVLSGCGEHCIGEFNRQVNVGSVFLIPPGIFHSYRSNQHLDVYHILIGSAFMKRYADELHALPGFHLLFEIEPFLRNNYAAPPFLTLTQEQLQEISPLLQLALNNTKYGGAGVHVMSVSLTLTILGYLCRYIVENTKVSPKSFGSNYLPAIVQSIEYMHQHYREHITIKVLCELTHLSRSTFLRSFEAICRCSPSDYLLNYRVSQAKNMLKDPKLSLSSIAELCGFCDQAYFSKVFRQQAGCTPRQYRASS